MALQIKRHEEIGNEGSLFAQSALHCQLKGLGGIVLGLVLPAQLGCGAAVEVEQRDFLFLRQIVSSAHVLRLQG